MADYTIFSDDSGSNGHRFHSLTLVAVPTAEVMQLSEQLNTLISNTGTTCTEWKKVGKQVKYTNACKALLGSTVPMTKQYDVLIQTLIWDIQDDRHTVSYRDDTANKQYMYRVAMVDLLKRHSVTEITWHPDTEWTLDFSAIVKDIESRLFFGPDFKRISQSSPQESPFLQIADLCSGIWRNYYEKHEKGSDWFKAGRPLGCSSCDWSRREVEQYKLLQWYFEELKKGGTAFEKFNGRLKTRAYGPRSINVWPYKPQHVADRAPSKRCA